MPNLIVKQIFTDIGGFEFLSRTGAKDLVVLDNTLRLRIPKNESGANRLEISLAADSTYAMFFFKVTDGYLDPETFDNVPEDIKVLDFYEGLKEEQLQEYFTNVTGIPTN